MVGPAEEGRLIAGRYRLMERIGRGGMGTVWRAEDELLDRQVAVKKLHPPQPHMPDEELATLFERTRREARAAARISHPNVIVVHDVVDDAGLPSIVMEYVPSVTLGELLKERGALPPAEAARIGRGMIAALRAAHRAGVLHRDVKPGNVLLGEGGRVVLTDFGIAQASGTSTLTRTGELIGSIDFLSPERIRGAMPGPEADLWALGATLYQAVEGTSPFRRPTAIETAYAIAEEPVVPAPNAGALTRVIAGLLAKEPAQRLSAEEAEQMLRIPAGEQDTALVEQVGFTQRLPASEPQPAQHSAGTPYPPTAYPQVTHPHEPQHGPPAGYEPARPEPSRRRPGRWAAAAVAVAVVAAGVAVAVDRANRSDAAGSSSGGTSGGPTATLTHTAPPTTPHTTEPTPTAPTTAPTTYEPPPVPDGYHLEHRADHGYSVPVPDGWTKKVTEDGDQISYVDPTQKVGLKISALDFGSPDPYQHFLDLEPQTRSQVKGYHRERLDPTKTASGQDAALWQFTFKGTSVTFRALDLGFGKEGGREYAVYLSAPKSQWATYRPVFDTAVAGFRQTD
ncbi:serine/threonine-protein kinase [Actinacidiphila bryophytorum]|uniref:non-specific serine/threonine protein kinase n=1 Tax=Actinacidiphila bryophytorum TaxID=1436133 RepID=A0A9W4E070_9ACTN|nr:serine/threonine-protein kinase [Actinacidiphila bryophytorum]MBM9436553.1 serine/threonine protein kinase [Actinacidiphila bryophytorum]CAG7600165.1 Non-specific serine/threonine protein kinase [Actinacidiphila bryophytorum]